MRIIGVKLKNGETLKFGDFNVFIGGNGVGKTTVLSELFFKFSDIQKNKWLWVDAVEFNSKDTGADMKLLKTSLARKYEGTNLFYYSNAVKNESSNIDLADAIRFNNEEHKDMDTTTNSSLFDQARYRRPFVSFSSCESRLTLGNEVAVAPLNLPPPDPINVLYRNKPLLENIDKNISGIFKYHFILLSHLGTQLNLGLSKEQPPVFNLNATELQDEYEKIENWKTDKFIPLSEAGHGIRSMIRLLTSLLEPVNQVIMIDEPEMHLYPSQKRWLGKQLVKLASKQGKQVFLVTHDPMILQGILDANTNTHIFRVDRDDTNNGIIKVCELDRVTDTHALRNQEQYLQGLFYQRCIVVEGASDRSFYQNMFEDFPEIQDKDLGLVIAGGTGSSKHMAHIVAKVGLKAAFIFDFDVLLYNTAVVKEIFIMLGGSNDPLSKLEALYKADTKVQEAKTDKEKIPAIKSLTGYSEKSGISGNWETANNAVINEVIIELGKVGIFIVPKGTLESWAPAVEPKVRFAELAPEIIRANQALLAPFKDFSKTLLKYLEIIIN